MCHEQDLRHAQQLSMAIPGSRAAGATPAAAAVAPPTAALLPCLLHVLSSPPRPQPTIRSISCVTTAPHNHTKPHLYIHQRVKFAVVREAQALSDASHL